MLIENKVSRHQKISPSIIAYLKSTENHQILCLYLKNVGEGYAKNVRVNFIKDYNQYGNKKLPMGNIGIAKNGFNIFPSQYYLEYHINTMVNLGNVKGELESQYIELEIDYDDSRNNKYHNLYRLPFNQIFDQNYSVPPETYIGQIPYYLDQINKTMENEIKAHNTYYKKSPK